MLTTSRPTTRAIDACTFVLAQPISRCLAEFFKHHGLLIGCDSVAVVDHRDLDCAAVGVLQPVVPVWSF
jgi:hypothetical protein